MIYTTEEYSKLFELGGTRLSQRSIQRRCKEGMLPGGHKAHKVFGHWIIEVEMFNETIRKNFNIQLTLKARQPV